MQLRHSREITLSGFAPDADPNVAEPLPALVFALGQDLPGGRGAQGHALVGAFDTEVAAGTASFRTWWKDQASGQWWILGEDTLTHRKRQVTSDLIGGSIFVQVLAFANAGLSTKFTLRCGEF